MADKTFGLTFKIDVNGVTNVTRQLAKQDKVVNKLTSNYDTMTAGMTNGLVVQSAVISNFANMGKSGANTAKILSNNYSTLFKDMNKGSATMAKVMSQNYNKLFNNINAGSGVSKDGFAEMVARQAIAADKLVKLRGKIGTPSFNEQGAKGSVTTAINTLTGQESGNKNIKKRKQKVLAEMDNTNVIDQTAASTNVLTDNVSRMDQTYKAFGSTGNKTTKRISSLGSSMQKGGSIASFAGKGVSAMAGPIGMVAEAAMGAQKKLLMFVAGMVMLGRSSPMLSAELSLMQYQTEQIGVVIGDALAPAFTALNDALSGAIDWYNNLDDSTKEVIKLTILVTTVLAALIAGLVSLAVMAPFAALILAVLNAVRIFQFLRDNIDKIVKANISAFGNMVAFFKAGIDNIIKGIKVVIGFIVGVGMALFNAFVIFPITLVIGAIQTLEKAFSVLVDVVMFSLQVMAAPFVFLATVIVGVIDAVLHLDKTISSLADGLAEIVRFVEYLITSFQYWSGVAGGVLQGMSDAIAGVLMPALQGLMDFIVGVGMALFNAFVMFPVSLFVGFLQTIGDVLGWIGSIIGGLWNGFVETVGMVIQGAIDLLNGFVETIVAIGTTIVDFLLEPFKQILDFVTQIVDGVASIKPPEIGGIPSPGDIGGGIGGLGNTIMGMLPKFATGGIVPGSAGQATPIMAHGEEMVLNKQQQASLLGGNNSNVSNSSTMNNNIVINISSAGGSGGHQMGFDVASALNNELLKGDMRG